MIGRVVDIIMHRRMCNEKTMIEPFLVVRNYRTLTDSNRAKDLYRLLAPHIDISLCYNQLEGQEHIIRLQDVHSHFAAYMYTPADIDRECVIVCSLNRD